MIIQELNLKTLNIDRTEIFTGFQMLGQLVFHQNIKVLSVHGDTGQYIIVQNPVIKGPHEMVVDTVVIVIYY